MIYVYDILVNFNDDIFNFYEWEDNDIITHIKKTLLVKVKRPFYNNVIKKSVIVDKEFLELIKNKTEVYNNAKIELLSYACIFTNEIDAIMVTFNRTGKIIERSKFLIDEENELLEISNTLTDKTIEYKVIKNIYEPEVLRRCEKKVLNVILKELALIKDDDEKIKYLYLEWFDKPSTKENLYEELINDIKGKFSNKHNEFLNVLKLIGVGK